MSNANPFGPASSAAPPPKKGMSTGAIVGIILGIMGGMLLLGLLVCAGLLFPAVQASREAARRMSCANNLKQIALALHNYESVYRAFPPAYTVDENGKPLHSWRTLILPYMEQNALYDKIDLSKPWDDPVNKPLAEMIIPQYCCPSDGNVSSDTPYQAVVFANGPHTGILVGKDATRISSIVDGLSNTVAVFECGKHVPWMSPQDADLDTFVNGWPHSKHAGGTTCAMGDGAVHFMSDRTPKETLKAMATKDAGETIDSF
ncbi:MAG: DUF1559 domain-containing protein [Pirellulales bacterium]